MTPVGEARRVALARARLYLCTPDRPDLAEFVTVVCEAGVDIVQLRDKELDDPALLERAVVARDAAHAAGALFVLNDRPDLAVACDADGVHVGQDDMPVDEARAIVGPGRIVGTSTHSPAQIDAAEAADVDYYAVGPVFETPTKAGRPATGWDLIAYAAGRSTKPWFAIGGMDAETARAAAAAGAQRVVVVRAIRDAADPEAAARAVRGVLETEDHVGAA